jgi:antitoxin component HigA of HigAB toxin-antitoxin module
MDSTAMTYADFIVKMAEINRVLDAPEIHTPEELARCQLLVIECEAFEKVAFPDRGADPGAEGSVPRMSGRTMRRGM